jgi:hypothetical protein
LRKIVSILLIFILFFNLGGYRLLFPLLQNHADRKLETLLDDNKYDESQLIEIRVAMNMPYQQRFTEYERHYGQIEIDGRSYTYVKKKVEGDIVIFKCIANESKQKLMAIQNDITNANSGAADMDHPGQSKQLPSFAKNILSDYDDQTQFHLLVCFAASNTATGFNYNLFIPEVTASTPHQPPKC